jgi:tetratricopeptide (TPR) repeat protein
LNPSEWEQATGKPAPALARQFLADPDAALDALLTGGAGSTVAHRGPAGVLAAWLTWFNPSSEFAQAVDGAVTRRVADEWEPSGEGRRRALRLIRLFDIVSSSPGKLVHAPDELRSRFETHGDALGPWSSSPSEDPLGRYLLALARTQPDRSRAPFWFAHCRLPASVPLFRADYGIAGLRGLPPAEPRDDEFPYEVASGLRVLADGVRRGVLSGRFDLTEATRTFVSIGKVCIATYPLGGWSDELLIDSELAEPMTRDLLSELAALDQRAVTADVLRRAFPTPKEKRPAPAPLPAPPTTRRRAPGRRESAIGKSHVQRLLTALRRGKQGSVDRTEVALRTERVRVERSGDFAAEIGALLAQASSAAREHFPAAAVSWAEEALEWEPWDVRAWTVVTAAYRAAGRATDGLDAAWRAHARFPFNPYVWTELGEVLAADHRTAAAEAVLTEAMSRFPDDEAAISSYCELLIATGRAAEAVPILEEATDRFEDTAEHAPRLWAGLVAALISIGHIDAAKDAARRGYELLPNNAVARQFATRFDRFKRERLRRDAAYAAAGPQTPAEDGPVFSVISEARVLRQRARSGGAGTELDEAWKLLERTRARGGEDPQFVAEVALVQNDRGQPEQALKDVESTPFRDTTHLSVALAVTRAKRVALLSSGTPGERRYSEVRMAQLTAELRSAALSNAALQPLEILARLQSSAALTDGAAVASERERAHADLMGWMRRIANPVDDQPLRPEDEELVFTDEWAGSLSRVWSRLGRAPAGDVIAERATQQAPGLDGLQETFEHRIASMS